MKNHLLFLIFISTTTVFSQVGINTSVPADGAMLDVTATDKGILIPRVTIADLNTPAPITGGITEGMMVYNTNTTTGKGFYFWDGNMWVAITSRVENIYTDNGTLAENRQVNQNANTLQFNTSANKNSLIVRRTDNTLQQGIAFRNSGNAYDASIYQNSGTQQGLVVATGGNHNDVDNVGTTAIFNDNTTTSFSNEIKVYEGLANQSGQDINTRIYGNADDGIIDVNENGVMNHRIHGNNTTIFNNQNLDLNFRVATDTNDNTLFIDGQKNNIGIGTNNPNNSAILDMSSSNRGFLAPRVSLNNSTDTSTIANGNINGLMVYNTNDSGNTIDDVKPGFYYWESGRWNHLRDQGFSLKYKQDNQVRASTSNSTYVALPNLTQNFVAPYSGKYQILVNAYYAVEQPTGSTDVSLNGSSGNFSTTIPHNSAGQGSIRLQMDSNTIEEKYVVSYGMAFPDNVDFWAHGQSVTIIHNVTLNQGQSYEFAVEGREWRRYNSTNAGIFGWETNLHQGNNGATTAQYGDLTITLINQF